MGKPANGHGRELCWVVLNPKSRGSEQQSQDLRICLCSPSCEAIEQEKHQQAAKQAAKQIEGSRSNAHSEEK
jgi:hypothetical protein